MRPFLVAMLEAEDSGNNYAAIALALTLPDVCGSIDHPGRGKSQERYTEWWDRYPAKIFEKLFPGTDDPALITGRDAWSLRNAFLHAGQDRLLGSGPVKRIRFIHSRIGSTGSDGAAGTIYLAVDLFVRIVREGVEKWLLDRKLDEGAQGRLNDLLEIISPDEFYDVFIDEFAVD